MSLSYTCWNSIEMLCVLVLDCKSPDLNSVALNRNFWWNDSVIFSSLWSPLKLSFNIKSVKRWKHLNFWWYLYEGLTMMKDLKQLFKLNTNALSICTGLYDSIFLSSFKATVLVLDDTNLFVNSPHSIFQQCQALRLAEHWMISSI